MGVVFEQRSDGQSRKVFRAVLADSPGFTLQSAFAQSGVQVGAGPSCRYLVWRVEQVVRLCQNTVERPTFGTLALFVVAQHYPAGIQQS